MADRVTGERVAEQTLLTCNANRLADRVVPIIRSNICLESIAEIGRLDASLKRKPQAYIVHMQAR